ncbi:guanine deaminase [Mariprofundus micogutta]|uniref:Guanine deaminase n=1 Tax=Mariprofundus micogutta TaxID=1921010 RepID=A0A1L8CPP9_9PROT|nr:nucleoside deaminase [Mariprofundus micogutta]GAV20888.1 guanine deaminase [Mariprofundus micogutta]
MTKLSPFEISIQLPEWSAALLRNAGSEFATVESRMALAISLSSMNIEHGTGGPFGAAIFNIDTHELLSIGMNLVVTSNCSMSHAEMVAISSAQQRLGRFDLGATKDSYELVSSCEPCAMCFGAIPWSGIRHLVCGARDEDARAIGFDEGPKMDNWQEALEKRGITVATDICRQEAADVLQQYANASGTIYNGRHA